MAGVPALTLGIFNAFAPRDEALAAMRADGAARYEGEAPSS
ncbi:hypothetical protein [Streptomyces lunalinharesii]|uniref:Uncharacterized protein n=1 Tax=Streptomyces lunalinharesii TaxID=333384 RepID=A0ABN3SVD1_9ACTN